MTRIKDSVSLQPISFGAIPSPKDYRDVALASVPAAGALPPSAFEDVSGLPVWHQRKIGACFPAGTIISMADGSYKDIEKIEIGEYVLNADGLSARVEDIMSRKWQGDLIEITPYGLQPIRATPEHPFLTNRGWVQTQELSTDDYIKTPGWKDKGNIRWCDPGRGIKKMGGDFYRRVRVKKTLQASKELKKPWETVYNLEVSNGHTYVAGFVAVHNCVGHAAGKYKQRLDQIETGGIFNLSARFLYAMAKSEDGVVGEGTYPRLVAKILKDYGCATEGTVENDTTLDHESYVYQRSRANIPQAAFDEAKKFKIGSYAFVDVKSATDMKRAVVEGHGAMLLMQIGKEWWTKDGKSTWAADDIVPLRPPKSSVGGHEVYLYGYEDVPGGRTKFYVFNSWSVDWGLAGKAWFYFDEYSPFLTEGITFVDLPNEIKDELQTLPPADKFTYTFANNLSYGQKNPDISAIQTALRIDGVYSGPVTGYYGTQTAAGVLAFWTKYNIASWWERTFLRGRSVGPRTRAKLNELFAK